MHMTVHVPFKAQSWSQKSSRNQAATLKAEQSKASPSEQINGNETHAGSTLVFFGMFYITDSRLACVETARVLAGHVLLAVYSISARPE